MRLRQAAFPDSVHSPSVAVDGLDRGARGRQKTDGLPKKIAGTGLGLHQMATAMR